MTRTQATSTRGRPHGGGPRHLSRRRMLAGMAALVVPATFAREVPASAQDGADEASAALEALERRAGGRLGVCILDVATGRTAGHRRDERFAMCSTFKLPLAGVVLREADAGRIRLGDLVDYGERDMVSYAPVTTANLQKGGMTVSALAEAAQVTSDNVAANLLLKRLGGPEGFTRLLRAAGDETTRLDRLEPELNLVLPGEVHDTTAPSAMAQTVSRLVVGDLLAPSSREMLTGWMIATATGAKRVRAGLPADWRAGDKTGSGVADAMTAKCNDVAVAWPPGKSPLVVAAYYDTASRSEVRPEHEAVLAEVGRIAARWIG